MENFSGLDRGEPVMVERSIQFGSLEAPARIGRATERPTRLKDGDFLEAVSRAVLRQIEGGMVRITIGFVANPYDQIPL